MEIEATQAIPLSDDEDLTDDEIGENSQIATLKVLKRNGYPETDFPVYEGINLIGRDSSCNIEISLKALSKQHAFIEVRRGQHFIVDKGSKNRTKRNKMSLDKDVRYEIKDGDQLTFADVDCVYSIPNANNCKNQSTDAAAKTVANVCYASDSDESTQETIDVNTKTSLVKDTPAQSKKKKAASNVMFVPDSQAINSPPGNITAKQFEAMICEESDIEDVSGRFCVEESDDEPSSPFLDGGATQFYPQPAATNQASEQKPDNVAFDRSDETKADKAVDSDAATDSEDLDVPTQTFVTSNANCDSTSPNIDDKKEGQKNNIELGIGETMAYDDFDDSSDDDLLIPLKKPLKFKNDSKESGAPISQNHEAATQIVSTVNMGAEDNAETQCLDINPVKDTGKKTPEDTNIAETQIVGCASDTAETQVININFSANRFAEKVKSNISINEMETQVETQLFPVADQDLDTQIVTTGKLDNHDLDTQIVTTGKLDNHDLDTQIVTTGRLDNHDLDTQIVTTGKVDYHDLDTQIVITGRQEDGKSNSFKHNVSLEQETQIIDNCSKDSRNIDETMKFEVSDVKKQNSGHSWDAQDETQVICISMPQKKESGSRKKSRQEITDDIATQVIPNEKSPVLLVSSKSRNSKSPFAAFSANKSLDFSPTSYSTQKESRHPDAIHDAETQVVVSASNMETQNLDDEEEETFVEKPEVDKTESPNSFKTAEPVQTCVNRLPVDISRKVLPEISDDYETQEYGMDDEFSDDNLTPNTDMIATQAYGLDVKEQDTGKENALENEDEMETQAYSTENQRSTTPTNNQDDLETQAYSTENQRSTTPTNNQDDLETQAYAMEDESIPNLQMELSVVDPKNSSNTGATQLVDSSQPEEYESGHITLPLPIATDSSKVVNTSEISAAKCQIEEENLPKKRTRVRQVLKNSAFANKSASSTVSKSEMAQRKRSVKDVPEDFSQEIPLLCSNKVETSSISKAGNTDEQSKATKVNQIKRRGRPKKSEISVQEESVAVKAADTETSAGKRHSSLRKNSNTEIDETETIKESKRGRSKRTSVLSNNEVKVVKKSRNGSSHDENDGTNVKNRSKRKEQLNVDILNAANDQKKKSSVAKLEESTTPFEPKKTSARSKKRSDQKKESRDKTSEKLQKTKINEKEISVSAKSNEETQDDNKSRRARGRGKDTVIEEHDEPSKKRQKVDNSPVALTRGKSRSKLKANKVVVTVLKDSNFVENATCSLATPSKTEDEKISSTPKNSKGSKKSKKALPTTPDTSVERKKDKANTDLSGTVDVTLKARGRSKVNTLQETAAVRKTDGKQSASNSSQESAPSTPTLRKKAINRKPKVMFTGVIDEEGNQIVQNLGGELVNNISTCTHLVTDKVRRTVKFLCALGRGLLIVNPNWLEQCRDSKMFIDAQPFIVKDRNSEKSLNFNLLNSLSHVEEHGGLLRGYSIHVTSGVKPEPGQMKEIISSAEGKYLTSLPKKEDKSGKTVVISCPEDIAKCKDALNVNLPVVSAEFVLTGMLQQKLDFKKYKLEEPSSSTTRNKRKSRKT